MPVTPPARLPLFDPTALPPGRLFSTSFATFDAHTAGIKPPRLKNADGSLRPIQDWARELSADPSTAVNQVAAALWHGNGAAYHYVAASLDDLRPNINPGLKQGGGECQWFAAVAYLALSSSGRFRKEDLAVMQVYADGGWHNVLGFRNPSTGKWDIINYENVVSVGADSPEAAMAAFFGTHEKGYIYSVDDPDEKARIRYRVRSDHQATLTAMLSQPGIDSALNPSFGSTAGLNEALPGALTLRGDGLTGSTSGVRVRVGGVTVSGRVGANGPDRVGLSMLKSTGSGDLAGGKALLSRDATGQGANLFAGGEWWRFRDRGYVGVVAGMEGRLSVGTQRTDDQTLTTLAPVAAIQGGVSGNIVGDSDSRGRVGWFANGRLQLGLPFVLTAADRASVSNNANGFSPNGLLDPGFLGMVAIDINGGSTASYQLTPRLTLSGTATVRAEAQDWTLDGSPVAVGGSLDARLAYDGKRVDGMVGGTTGHGLYDRDVRVGAYAGVSASLSRTLTLGGAVSLGKFTSESTYANAQVTVEKKLGKTTINGGVGITATQAPGSSPEIAPSLGLTITH